jgi:hypothetical protein
MPDLRPSPPAAADGEPLAPLEFGIRHTESAAIEVALVGMLREGS